MAQWWGHENPREENTTGIIDAPTLKNLRSIDQLLDSSGPTLNTRWEASTNSFTEDQRKLRQIQSGLGKKVQMIPKNIPKKKPSRIDNNLLEQAFKFGQKYTVNTNSFIPATAPSSDICFPSIKKKQGKNKKKKTKTYDKTIEFSRRNEPDEAMVQMIQNFQNGTKIKQLREQLNASKRSLGNSNKFIESATQQWFSTP